MFNSKILFFSPKSAPSLAVSKSSNDNTILSGAQAKSLKVIPDISLLHATSHPSGNPVDSIFKNIQNPTTALHPPLLPPDSKQTLTGISNVSPVSLLPTLHQAPQTHQSLPNTRATVILFISRHIAPLLKTLQCLIIS